MSRHIFDGNGNCAENILVKPHLLRASSLPQAERSRAQSRLGRGLLYSTSSQALAEAHMSTHTRVIFPQASLDGKQRALPFPHPALDQYAFVAPCCVVCYGWLCVCDFEPFFGICSELCNSRFAVCPQNCLPCSKRRNKPVFNRRDER